MVRRSPFPRLVVGAVAACLALIPACADDGHDPAPTGSATSISQTASSAPTAPDPVGLPVFADDPCATASDEPDPEYEALLARWTDQEAAAPLEPGRVVVTGSSSIRMWSSLNEEFSSWAPVQRGFGGAWLSEVAGAVDVLIAPHAPSAVVVFAGANDLAEGATVERTFDAYRCLLTRIRDDVGNVPVAMITVTPTPLRWEGWPEAEAFHRLVIELSEQWSGLHVVDGREAYLATGTPPDDGLFLPDRLHLNAEGYALWDAQVHAALDEVLGPAPAPGTVVDRGEYGVQFVSPTVDADPQPPGVLLLPVDGPLTAGEQWRLVDAAGAVGPRLVVADWNLSATPDGTGIVVRPSAAAHLTLEGVEAGTEVAVTMRPADPAMDPVVRTAVSDALARAHVHLVDADGADLEVTGLEIAVGD
jgi:hypothetical protein